MIIDNSQTNDLTICDQEPIHIPGSIQSHGVMFVLADDNDFRITQVSTSTPALLNRDYKTLLNVPISDVIGDSITTLKQRYNQLNASSIQSFGIMINERFFEAILHRNIQGQLILELEPDTVTDSMDARSIYTGVQQAVDTLENAPTLQDLYQRTVDRVRDLTGFDRVKLYRFDPDWHGIVVAESRTEDMASYLGLHFPATDIPKQARALYVRNRMRLIADVNATPAGIWCHPDNNNPLDMSDMTLRAVSPIHIEYLGNMGVGASMSISILKDGVLWGLIACHHKTALHVPYRIRTICKLLSLTVSTQLIAKEQQALNESRLQSHHIQDEIFEVMVDADDPLEALKSNAGDLLKLIDASGLAIWLDGHLQTTGITPDFEQTQDIILLLQQLDRDIYATDRLVQIHAPSAAYADIASGMLAIKISQTLDQYIIWFRPEQVQTVTWGGNPEKSVNVEENGEIRVTPRKSFEQWSQQTEQTSIAWGQDQIDAARLLRSNIVDVILRRVNELQQLNLRLERSNLELDAFAYIASHDLKEPLRGIHNYSSILVRRYADELGEDGQNKLDTLVRLTQRLDSLLDSLLHYSRVGRLALNLVETDLNTLIENVQEALSARIEENNAQVIIPQPLPAILCDGTQLTEVYANLISNAIKYNDSDHIVIEVGYQIKEDDSPIFYIKDNGIGIPEKHQESIFRIFKRLHRRNDYGGGIGAGLTIVQKIIERHNGTIWLDSSEGNGTTFFFTLDPLNDAV